MNVALFGATGMVGQGVLRECLADPLVERVLVLGRPTTFSGRAVTTSKQLGHAMLAVARSGYPKRVLETRDINAV